MIIENKEVKVEAGKFLEVTGPAAVRVKEGEALLMGKPLETNDLVVVPQWRTYVIKATKDCVLSISLTKETVVNIVDSNVFEVWTKNLEKLVDFERVVIAGPTDSGKSSVTATLLNLNLRYGKEISVIDSDVGQNNLCYPTMVCKTRVRDFVFMLSDLEGEEKRFTGTITPPLHTSRVISSVSSLVKGKVVVDTDGWVDGYDAGYYKHSLLRAVEPDAVVYMGKAPWWAKGPWELVELPPSPGKERNREDRRSIRKNKYRKVLEKCKSLDVDLRRVPVLYSVLFTSPEGDEALKEAVKELIGVKPLMVVTHNKKIIAVVPKRSKYRKVKEVEVIEEGEERGLLVGLGDGKGNEEIGMVVRIDFKSKILKVKSCFDRELSYVSFGSVKLDEDFSDHVWRKPI